MAKSIKIRAKLKGDTTTVKCLMTHPMETGTRKDSKTGELVPAHFIQEVNCKHGDATLFTAYWSGGVSKNPYLSFKFDGGEKGDAIEITWVDNKGETETGTAGQALGGEERLEDPLLHLGRHAVDLVEDWLVVGGTVLPAGTLLISMDGEDLVGSNDLSTTRRDVFALMLTATTAGSGTGVGCP